MSDFIADLEAELVAAARRRAGRHRRRVVLVPRLRPATVLAVLALAVLLVAVLAAVRELGDGTRPADERPAPTPGPGATFPLPAAEQARPCPGVAQREMAGDAPPQGIPLSIFTRPQTEPDAIPSLTGADSYTWIPAGTIYPAGARRPAPEQFDAELHLVPAAEPRQGDACDGRRDAVLGVCLVVGAGEAVVKCFSDAEVEAGRAFALTSPGVVHGIAPDGVAAVTLDAPSENVSAAVHDNAFEIVVPAVAGDPVRIELEMVRECRGSGELLDAVPALRGGGWQTLPAAAEDAMPSAGLRQWARRIETGDSLELWAITRCGDADRACVLAVHDGNWVAQPCATARELRKQGTSWTFPVPGRLGVAGMAPPGTRGVQVVSGDRVHDLAFSGGVFGGLLPPAFGRSVDPGDEDAAKDLRVQYLR
jgi:hypothetical protein